MGAGFVQILGDVGAIVRSEVIPGIRVEFIPRSIGFGRKSQSWATFLPVYASKRLLNSWSVQVMDMAPFPVMKGGLEGRRLLMVSRRLGYDLSDELKARFGIILTLRPGRDSNRQN